MGLNLGTWVFLSRTYIPFSFLYGEKTRNCIMSIIVVQGRCFLGVKKMMIILLNEIHWNWPFSVLKFEGVHQLS